MNQEKLFGGEKREREVTEVKNFWNRWSELRKRSALKRKVKIPHGFYFDEKILERKDRMFFQESSGYNQSLELTPFAGAHGVAQH